MIAIRKSSLEIAFLILKARADTAKGDGYVNALHLAAKADNFETVNLLLRYGSDRVVKDATNSIPLHYAQSPRIVSLLLDKE